MRKIFRIDVRTISPYYIWHYYTLWKISLERFSTSCLGVRILDGPMTDSLEAMAFNMKDQVNAIYSCSWGPDDNGKTVDGPHQLAQVCSDVYKFHWTNKVFKT